MQHRPVSRGGPRAVAPHPEARAPASELAEDQVTWAQSCPGIICADNKKATLLLFLISFVQIWTRQEQLAPGTLLAHGA